MPKVSAGRLHYLAVILCLCQINAGALVNQGDPSLKAFFRGLVEHYDPNALPSMSGRCPTPGQGAPETAGGTPALPFVPTFPGLARTRERRVIHVVSPPSMVYSDSAFSSKKR